MSAATLHICLAGVESTGKTVVGERVARQLGALFMAEYGRDYAQTAGTDFAPGVLHTIARVHAARRQRLLATRPRLLIEDTDVVMTAAWFTMLHGGRDAVLSAMPAAADLYLLFAPDTPWVADGTRQFGGAARTRFHAIILAELQARGLTPIMVGGSWKQRLAAVVDNITARLDSVTAAGA